MTRDEILALEGPALDAAVAEQVYGWTDLYRPPPPCFSSDLNAVADAEKRLDADPDRRIARGRALYEVWFQTTIGEEDSWCELNWGEFARTTSADAATRCRALLLAVNEKGA